MRNHSLKEGDKRAVCESQKSLQARLQERNSSSSRWVGPMHAVRKVVDALSPVPFDKKAGKTGNVSELAQLTVPKVVETYDMTLITIHASITPSIARG